MKSQQKVLFVGMNPSAQEVKRQYSALGRLDKWAKEMGLDRYSFTNCSLTPGPFDPKSVTMERVIRGVGMFDRVVALGNVPSDLLRKAGVEHFKLPHPSYRNRKLNDPEYERRVVGECAEYINSFQKN